MGYDRVSRDDGLLGNLDARPFGLPDRLLLQVVSLIQGPLEGDLRFRESIESFPKSRIKGLIRPSCARISPLGGNDATRICSTRTGSVAEWE